MARGGACTSQWGEATSLTNSIEFERSSATLSLAPMQFLDQGSAGGIVDHVKDIALCRRPILSAVDLNLTSCLVSGIYSYEVARLPLCSNQGSVGRRGTQYRGPTRVGHRQ